MTADIDPVKVAREACANYIREYRLLSNVYVNELLRGDKDDIVLVHGAILGARAMQAAMAGGVRVKALDVDALAQEIRRVDGQHKLGAGALAEALMPFLSALEPAGAQEGATAEHRKGLSDSGNDLSVNRERVENAAPEPDVAGLVGTPADIAKSALGIDWSNTESAARRVAEYAADRIEALQAEVAAKDDSLKLWHQTACEDNERATVAEADLAEMKAEYEALADTVGKLGEDLAEAKTARNKLQTALRRIINVHREDSQSSAFEQLVTAQSIATAALGSGKGG